MSIILGLLLLIHHNSASLLVAAGVTAILLELISNCGVTFIASVLAAESFATPKKPTSISFIIAVENTIQVILLLATFAYTAKREFNESWLVPIVFGSIGLVVSAYVVWKLPETGQLSMRDSVKKFKNLNINVDDGITYA